MNKHKANLINAFSLIVLGLWGYLASETPSVTALIPVVAGLLLLGLHKGVMNENKVQAHVAVVITLLVLIGLVKPLLGAFDRSQPEAIARVMVMMATSLYAMADFIKGFFEARKNR